MQIIPTLILFLHDIKQQVQKGTKCQGNSVVPHDKKSITSLVEMIFYQNSSFLKNNVYLCTIQ